jgi:hypothetical protein
MTGPTYQCYEYLRRQSTELIKFEFWLTLCKGAVPSYSRPENHDHHPPVTYSQDPAGHEADCLIWSETLTVAYCHTSLVHDGQTVMARRKLL